MIKPPKVKDIVQWVVFAGVVYLAVHFYLPGHTKYHELLRKEKELDDKIDRLQGEMDRMREEKHLLESDVLYLEKVVRENLGRVEPGETVYKVVNVPDPTPGYQIQDSEKEEGDL